MEEKYLYDYPIEPDDEDVYGAGASAYDCTGLIPAEPKNEDELEAYDDIYSYRPEEDY